MVEHGLDQCVDRPGGVERQVRNDRRLEVKVRQVGRGVTDLVLIPGEAALGQAADQFAWRQMQPHHRGFGRDPSCGGGPGRRHGPFGAKGGDQHDGTASEQVGLGQIEQCVVARGPGQARQDRVV
jgi:microcompartment protein CcmK/EutM